MFPFDLIILICVILASEADENMSSEMGMCERIRDISCLVFFKVDYDFVVLAENIIIHQTETIPHYQSQLSRALFSAAPKKTQK